MKVLCQQCRHEFEIPSTSVGKVEFSQCRNLFRVTYKYRSPCPKCRAVLELTPSGPDLAHGHPIPFESDEITEQFEISQSQALDETLPRARAQASGHAPIPTVRVTRTVKRPIQPDRAAFRVMEGTLLRPRPIHVSLRSKKRLELPYLKLLIGGVAALGTMTTILLTFLAFRQDSLSPDPIPPSAPTQFHQSEHRPNSPEPYAVQNGPMGGPFEPVALHTEETEEPLFYVPLLDHLTSKFGVREDPINGHSAFHGGIDMAIHSRAEIPAALSGVVKFSGWRRGYGNTVILSHPDGYETIYAHMTKSLVLKGAKIAQGDIIGLVGTTGRSTGNHLHFEVRKDGERVDPLQLRLIKNLATT